MIDLRKKGFRRMFKVLYVKIHIKRFREWEVTTICKMGSYNHL